MQRSRTKAYESVVAWYRDWDGPISKRKIKRILHKGVRSKDKQELQKIKQAV